MMTRVLNFFLSNFFTLIKKLDQPHKSSKMQ